MQICSTKIKTISDILSKVFIVAIEIKSTITFVAATIAIVLKGFAAQFAKKAINFELQNQEI